jgi:hypothetical protein
MFSGFNHYRFPSYIVADIYKLQLLLSQKIFPHQTAPIQSINNDLVYCIFYILRTPFNSKNYPVIKNPFYYYH